MKVEVHKDEATDVTTLKIAVPLTETKQSRSGNSTVIASTKGQQFIGKVHGRDTYLQLNVLQMESAGGGIELVGPEDQEEESSSAPQKRKYTRRAA